MVVPIVGFPAGQSVEQDGIVVTLTYFNRSLESHNADGKATFMIVNLRDESQTATISLALAFAGGDFFKDHFKIEEVVSPRSVVWRTIQNEKMRTATFAKFAIFTDNSTKSRFSLADFVVGDAPKSLLEL